ncbi:MAG: aminopeptidase N, partial [Bifidobacteriaceae bacterium]|nr:aminopeptidase N [Bifidobacteriaceae bacterium]
PDLQEDNELVVVAKCRYSHTGEGLHRFTDPADGLTYLYTQFEPADACRVLAVFEQPDLKGIFELTVTAPGDWKVISNQPLAGQQPATPAELASSYSPAAPAGTATPPADAAAAPTAASANNSAVGGSPTQMPDAAPTSAPVRHWFEPTPRLSSYLIALCAGPYAEWHSQVQSTSGRTVPMALYARQSMAQFVDPDDVFELTRQGFSFYEPAFDYPYPFAKYDQIFCPEYNFGAMENAGLVTITENYIFRSKPVEALVERRAVTILHELAHMWFGDLVTMRWWNDLWLNESFAEFISHLAAVRATRFKDAWTTFAYTEKTWAYAQDQLPTTHPILAPIENLDDVHNNFDGITYAKGASVLRQLMAWVGEDVFLQGLRSYFVKHAWGNTELPDLLGELEAASGRDLTNWTKLWLETAGVNTLTADSARTTLSQSGKDPYPAWRPALVAVGGYSLVDGELNRFWDTEVDLAGPQTPLPKLRPADLLLLNDRDLAYAKIRLDPESLVVAREQVGKMSDPLARSVVWGMLWDMTRDAEWSARQFADKVLTWAFTETSSTALQKLLAELATALDHFVAPEFQLETRANAAARLWEALAGSQPGSDTQLQLVRAFARHATTEGQIDQLDELVLGSRTLTGLTMDLDLTWDLMGGLVVAGRAGEDRIDAQLAADKTQSGLEKAAGLRAALPTPEAKAAAWLRAVEDPATPNGTQRAIIAGWARVRDKNLLVPFVEPYFASVRRIWQDRSPETAMNVATGMYPDEVADLPGVDVLGATKAFLTELGGDLPPLRRLVVEGEAGVQRALAAQAADRAAGAPLG